LQSTNIPVFQQTVLKWQREYSEGTLVLTPTILATKADQECQILKHAGQWVETIDPSVVAMQAIFQTTKNRSGPIFQSLAANFSSIAQKQKDINHSLRGSHKSLSQGDTPDWLLRPPTMRGQIKHFNGRDWHYCTKCGRNGHWVCTHTDETHDDNKRYAPSEDYRRSPSPLFSHYHRAPSALRDGDNPYPRSRSPGRQLDSHRGHRQRYPSRSRSRSPPAHGYNSDSSVSHRHVTWDQRPPDTPVAKLFLLETINVFLDEDD